MGLIMNIADILKAIFSGSQAPTQRPTMALYQQPQASGPTWLSALMGAVESAKNKPRPMFGEEGSPEQALLQETMRNQQRGVRYRNGAGDVEFLSGARIDRTPKGRALASPYGTGSVVDPGRPRTAQEASSATINGMRASDWFQNQANTSGPNKFAKPEPGYAGTPMTKGSESAWIEAMKRMGKKA